MQEQPLSPAKRKAAKKQLIGQLAISSDSGETQCLAMGKSLLAFGKISTFQEDRARIEAVTAQELQETARSIFAPGKISKLVYL